MFRLWRFEKIRKRTVVAILTAIALVIGAGSVILVLVAASLHGGIPYFRVLDQSLSGSVIGAGWNMGDIPSTNLLYDTSFEPYVIRKQMTVLEGDDQSVDVSADVSGTDLFGEGFFEGADIRIVSPTAQGMTLLKNTRVKSYHVNQIGTFQSVQRPAELPDDLYFSDFAYQDGTMVAAGQKGTVLIGLDNTVPVPVSTGLEGDLTGIVGDPGGGFIVCSEKGEVSYSADLAEWSHWQVAGAPAFRALTVSGNTVIAVGDNGGIYAGSTGSLKAVTVDATADLRDVAYGNGLYLACGDQNTVLVSSNGAVWEPIEAGASANWSRVDFIGDRFVLVGSGGQVCVFDADRVIRPETVPNGPNLLDIACLTRELYVVLDTQGQIYLSSDGADTWVETGIEIPDVHINRLTAMSENLLAGASSAGWTGLARLVNEIELDSVLGEGAYQAGDLLYLEQVRQSVPATENEMGKAAWSLISGTSANRMIVDAAPASGTGCMRLTLSPEDTGTSAVLSQTLVREGEETVIEKGRLYTVEIWLRQQDVQSREVMIWLSGRFESDGTVIENVGNTWKKYTYTFIPPLAASNTLPGEIRLNIGMEGPGSVWLDGVWFGLSEEDSGQPESAFSEQIEQVSPAVMRMSHLGIGSSISRSGSWAYASGNGPAVLQNGERVFSTGGSLESTLALADRAGALPWLTLDPYVSDGELRNLMEYLAGPITAPYGNTRMENGSVRPWSDVFPRIYLEFRDVEGLLASDVLRASHVNHLLKVIRESAWYPVVRNQLVFIDGMPYDDALMLSSADYHASSLSFRIRQVDRRDDIANAYRDLFDRSPRIMDRPNDVNYELIHTTNISFDDTHPSTLGTWVDTFSTALRDGYDIVLSQHDGERLASGPLDPESAAIAIMGECGTGEPLEVEVLSGMEGPVSAFAFRQEGKVSILLVNHGTQVTSFPIESQISLTDAAVHTYDSEGYLVANDKLRRITDPVDVLAGGVSILIVDTAE